MTYEHPLINRYSSKEMSNLFTRENRFKIWRNIWTELAKAQKSLGIDISESAIRDLENNIDNIDLNRIDDIESETHHDVMANILAYGEQAKEAKGIIHLGMTSCDITDNADLIIIRKALSLLRNKLGSFIKILLDKCEKYANLACLGYTHYQVAQPTTVGKRFSLWTQDFYLDLKELDRLLNEIPFRGIRGATGTQYSFLSLLGSENLVHELEYMVGTSLGFKNTVSVCGQTYTRKLDQLISNILTGIGSSASKMATDIRLLSHDREVSESFGKKQVGSSAMPHKRNPLYSERICGLARHLNSLSNNISNNASSQWLERSLDDSSNRRISIPDMFMTVDAIIDSLYKVISDLKVNEHVIIRNLEENKNKLICEHILMMCSNAGLDRQETHEKLNRYSDGNLLEQIKKDKYFSDVDNLDVDVNYLAGLSASQTYRFVEEARKWMKDHLVK